MPRPRRHLLTAAVRRTLRRPGAPTSRRFLALLDRRLAALEAGRPLRRRPEDRPLARRFLAPFAGRWDDGDENLVRGYLDRWRAPGAAGSQDPRSALVEAASSLSRIVARPGTLFFLLWEMESVLDGLEAEASTPGAGAADKPVPAC